MGEILVEGKGALAFLQKMLTNDVAGLKEGQIKYSPVCYPDGGTVDDILVYCFHGEKYLLVVNAGNAEKDFAWFSEHCPGDVTLRDLSGETAQIALQGPNSLDCVSFLGGGVYDHFIPSVSGIMCLRSTCG